MRNQIAQTKNILMLATASDALTTRSAGEPGMGLIWGPSGIGKSSAVTSLYNQLNGVYVRAWPTWTPVSMLADLMSELGLKPMARTAPMIQAIVRALADQSRPIFIDEADYLADKPILLETLRSLHDVSCAPFILIGMKDFQRRVMHRDQLAGRISQWVPFQPSDMEDVRTVTDEVCEKQVADDLLERLYKAAGSGSSIRRIIVGLSRIEAFAKKKDLSKVNSREWGDRPFFLGDAPRELAKAAA